MNDTTTRTGLAPRCAMLAALAAAAVALRRRGARAQTAAGGFPSRSVRIVSGFSPGGPTDVLARVLADRLGAVWRQPVVVENRPGAGGNIGAEHVARAAPDGHMLLLVSSAHVQTPPLVPRLPYDPLRDFTPIMQIAYYPLVLCVLPGFPAQTFAEFLAYQGTRVVANRPEEAAAFIRDEVAKWAEVVRAADIRAE